MIYSTARLQLSELRFITALSKADSFSRTNTQQGRLSSVGVTGQTATTLVTNLGWSD